MRMANASPADPASGDAAATTSGYETHWTLTVRVPFQGVHACVIPRVTLAALLLGANILSEFCWAQGAGDGSDGGDGPDYVYDEYDAEGPATVTTGAAPVPAHDG